MFAKTIATAVLTLLATAGIAAAQSPARIEQFNAWGAYYYQGQAGKVCYVLTVPEKGSANPANVDHGEIFFLVTQRPGQNISYEPQAMLGYELKDGSKVNIKIDDRNFVLFTKGRSAWVENAAEEPALVAAMKSGKAMSMAAVSKKGTQTGYTFSLSGISKALKRIENCQ
jgi:hypothetical protein